jgi:hypothetical protein
MTSPPTQATVPPADVMAGTAEQPQRPRTLTELQKELESWTKQLRSHTAARNFLYQAYEGSVPLPVMSLSGPGVEANINMRALPGDYAKAIIQVILEHEEFNALYAWEQVWEIGDSAKKLIEQMQAKGDEAPDGFRETGEPAPEVKEQDDRETKLGAIARGMLEDMARGEPEPDQ